MLMTFMCSPCFCILPTIWSWKILRFHNKLVKNIALSNIITILSNYMLCMSRIRFWKNSSSSSQLCLSFGYHAPYGKENICVHQMKVGWTLYFSNYPLPYLSAKSKKTCHKKCQHLLLGQYHMKTWQWKLVYKNWPQMFWKKTNWMFKPSFW